MSIGISKVKVFAFVFLPRVVLPVISIFAPFFAVTVTSPDCSGKVMPARVVSPTSTIVPPSPPSASTAL